MVVVVVYAGVMFSLKGSKNKTKFSEKVCHRHSVVYTETID
jgi:penicillin-binding protein-related factor A (putative recombinase)